MHAATMANLIGNDMSHAHTHTHIYIYIYIER